MSKELKIDELNYEQGMKELEKILEELEDGDKGLDESMENFKIGMKLYKHCNELLSKTEGEIQTILEEDDDLEQNFLEGVD